MKLLSFSVDNEEKYGAIVSDGIIDLHKLFPELPDLKSFVASQHSLDIALFAGKKADYHQGEVTFLPVITRPNKIICAGMTYREKCAEFNEKGGDPTLFIRFADTQTGHRCGLIKPTLSNEFDYEGELAVIIGRQGSHIPADEAFNYIAGYSCYMDGSVRDWQHSWFTAGKNWPATGGFGPWMVTPDEIPDPQNLNIITRLNGKEVQNDNTHSMLHSIKDLIAYISTFTTLSPGDVILTGSPGGVGKKRSPPLFLWPGDIVEVEISRIGCLINHIISDNEEYPVTLQSELDNAC
ncbi:fumarylacetoacetate hydrolase family protein [Escherichia coli]|nr:FAA hydrolase family protein [Escherichia coli]EAA5675189.1 FAA hydrolase family protein [Escherichia coli]EEZ0169076.1 FAA hydrolase family protein [Escherichia coli]EFD5258555.1 fumarylacetoacetate hydrolase family protein [Escherichia coli]EFG2660458.1 fumarylacetoacetate hydrolase family protein [Escherichia coli]